MRDSSPPRRPIDAEAQAAEAALLRALGQAGALGRTGRVREALAAAQPLLAAHPRDYRVLGLLGVLYAQHADIHHALYYLTEALASAPPHPVELLTDLALVYTQAGAPLHAMQTWRSLKNHYTQVKRQPDLPDPDVQMAALGAAREPAPGLAGLPPDRAEAAQMTAERAALRLLAANPLPKVESECRAALRLAPRYAAPVFTLAQAQFWDGQPAAALATVETLLTAAGGPAAACAAWATYAYWAGHALEACRARLVAAAPARTNADRLALAAAWGLLGADAAVLDLVAAPAPDGLPDPTAARLRATALANTGDLEAAQDIVRPLRGDPDPTIEALLTALDHAAPVPGSGGRYPYVGWAAVVPLATLRRFVGRPPARRPFWQRPPPPGGPLRDRLLAVYPRLVEVGALMLWAGDGGVESLGVRLLTLLDTPAARQVLHDHLYGRAGSYAGRQDAGYALIDLGALPNGTRLPFWTGTDWNELHLYRLTPGGIYPARQEAEFAAQVEVVYSRQ